MVPTHDVRSTASRYSSCSTPTQRSTRLDRKQKKEYLASPWMTHVGVASNKPRWPHFLKSPPWRFSFDEATSSRKILFYSELSCHIYHQIHYHPSVFLHILAERDYNYTLGSRKMIQLTSRWCLAYCTGVVLNTVRESATPDYKENKQADAGSRLFPKTFSVLRGVV